MEIERQVVINVEDLKKVSRKGADFFILLNGGLRSSKHIYWDGKKFYVCNYIDGSDQYLSEDELETESNIAEALRKRALFLEVVSRD